MAAIDNFSLSDVAAGSYKFVLLGGKYGLSIVSTFGGGNIAFNKLGPDDATYILLATAYTTNTYAVFDLPPGTYELVITTATATYANLCGIPE
jgi:hypothetical protein